MLLILMWDNAIVELGVGKMDMTKVASWCLNLSFMALDMLVSGARTDLS